MVRVVTGNVFERPPVQEGLPSTILNNSKNSASSSLELRPDTTETARKRDSEMKREPLNTSVPSPHFQSRSGMLSHIGGTCSHNGMMDYPKIPIAELNLGKFPDSMEFRSWNINFRTEVCLRTADPQITMLWINEVEIAKSVHELMTSRSIVEHDFPDFDRPLGVVVDDVLIFCDKSLCTGLKSRFWFVPVAASLLALSFVLASDCHTWELHAASFWFESFSCRSPYTGYKTQFLTSCCEYPRTIWCTRTRRCWRACYSLRKQVQRRLRLCHKSFISSFFRPFRHRFGTAGRAEIANVEQMEKMVPFITVPFGVCLVSTYLIWIFGSRLILSNNQSSATLWVRYTCLIVGLLSLMTILITASLSSKM